MKFSSMRSAIVIASVVAGSVIPTQAFAQFDVLTTTNAVYGFDGTSISTYNFTSSMILNSIDFATNGVSNILSYKVGTGEFQLVDNSLLSTKDDKGFQRIYLGDLTVNAGTQVAVKMQGDHRLAERFNGTAGSNVTYVSLSAGNFGSHLTNSNLRVYNPGSTVPGASVAPEPGTFALALTGGAALLGICIRRRRNAA